MEDTFCMEFALSEEESIWLRTELKPIHRQPDEETWTNEHPGIEPTNWPGFQAEFMGGLVRIRSERGSASNALLALQRMLVASGSDRKIGLSWVARDASGCIVGHVAYVTSSGTTTYTTTDWLAANL
jgi:hypothetical protein